MGAGQGGGKQGLAMSSPTPTAGPKREMKLLSMGLPRSGTASITRALTILGFEDVHHGIKYSSRQRDWQILNRAADATFSNLPTYTGVPFTRAQWDELFGAHDATTDMAACFGMTLVDA